MALQIQDDNPLTDAKKNMQQRVEKAKEAYKESEKVGLVGRVKNWWSARVERNRAKGEAMKAKKAGTEAQAATPEPLVATKKPEEKTKAAEKKEQKISIEGEVPQQVDVQIDVLKLAEKDQKQLSAEEKKILLADEKRFQEDVATIKD